MGRCAWVDKTLGQCPAIGTMANGRSRTFYCREHVDCVSAAAGRQVIEDYKSTGVAQPITPFGSIMDSVGQLSGHEIAAKQVAKRKAAHKAEALSVYRKVRAAMELGGMSQQEAHEDALVTLYCHGRYARMSPGRSDPVTAFGKVKVG